MTSNDRITEHRIKMTAGGMAELEGSPKQIAWAQEIRDTFFEMAENMWSGAVRAIKRNERLGKDSEEIKSLKPEMLKILMDKYNQRQQQTYQC